MKKTVLMLSLAASLMVVSPLVHADLISFLNGVNNQALSDISSFNEKLSKQFGIPVPNVAAIVNSLPDPSDAFMVFQLSQMSLVAPEIVLQKYQRNQRSKKQGWGNLASDLGIKPGSREFHALKRGDFAFTGRGRGDDMERRDYREDRENRGEGEREQGHGHGHGNGRGRNKDRVR